MQQEDSNQFAQDLTLTPDLKVSATRDDIDKLWEQYDKSSDATERAAIKEDIADFAGSVGNIPFIDEDFDE